LIALAPFEGLSLIAQFNFQRASGFYRPNFPTQGTKNPRASLLFATSFSVAQKRGDFTVSAEAVKTFFEVFFFFSSLDAAFNRDSLVNLQTQPRKCKRFLKKVYSRLVNRHCSNNPKRLNRCNNL
jgi:hypothetical protein